MSRVDQLEFHSFFANGLSADSVVVDLGAHRGLFSGKFRDRYGATCHAVEANPEIFQALEQRNVAHCYHLAISDHVGTVQFEPLSDETASAMLEQGASAQNMVDVPCADLESFLTDAGLPKVDLLKVDIEGAEIDMLAACSNEFLRSIPQITIEFHDFCNLTPPAVLRKTLDRMEALGFEIIRFSRVGHQDTLLVHRQALGISKPAFLYAKYVYRNLKGLQRVMRKLFMGRNWAKGYD